MVEATSFVRSTSATGRRSLGWLPMEVMTAMATTTTTSSSTALLREPAVSLVCRSVMRSLSPTVVNDEVTDW